MANRFSAKQRDAFESLLESFAEHCPPSDRKGQRPSVLTTIQYWFGASRRKLGSWIAGVKLDEDDE